MMDLILPLDPCLVPLPQPATEVYLNHDIMHHIIGFINAHLVIPSTSERRDQPSPTFYRRIVKRDVAPQTLGMEYKDCDYFMHDYTYVVCLACQSYLHCRLRDLIVRPFGGLLKLSVELGPDLRQTLITKLEFDLIPERDAIIPDRVNLLKILTIHWDIQWKDWQADHFTSIAAARAELKRICRGLRGFEIYLKTNFHMPAGYNLGCYAPHSAWDAEQLTAELTAYIRSTPLPHTYLYASAAATPRIRDKSGFYYERDPERLAQDMTAIVFELRSLVHDCVHAENA